MDMFHYVEANLLVSEYKKAMLHFITNDLS